MASLVGRFYPDATTELQNEEARRLFEAINNNIPGLLQEMQIGESDEKLARGRVPFEADVGFARMDGPLISAYMQVFADKVGFALFYETSKSILPLEGAISSRGLYER